MFTLYFSNRERYATAVRRLLHHSCRYCLSGRGKDGNGGYYVCFTEFIGKDGSFLGRIY